MALTAIEVYLSPPPNRGTSLPFDGLIEYSRNERGREIVTLNFTVTPSDGTAEGEELTFYMMKARRERNEEVAQARQVFTIPAGAQPAGGYSVSWDLRNVVYSTSEPFPIMRRGDYFIDVEHTGGTTGPSSVTASTDDFRVALMTVDRFEAEWLLGATRRSNDDRLLRIQPRCVTGVRVVEVSKNHPLDMFPLKLSYSPGSGPVFLSWNHGENVNIDITVNQGSIHRQYILMDEFRENYIVVQVDPRLLPTQDTHESLMVDRQLIERESLRRWLDEEAQWLEEIWLHMPIEPALIVSDYTLRDLSVSSGAAQATLLPENFDYDIMSGPVTYYAPRSGHWVNFDVPYGRPIKFEYLVGALETTRIVDINPQWVEKGPGRHIQLLPFNQSLAYNFIGLMYMQFNRGAVEMPSFWRYRYWAGLTETTTPLPVLECMGLRAANKALTILGQAFRGGFSSQSVSRGGVSESVGYTSSAMYGIYSSTSEFNIKRLESLQKELKRKYMGLSFTVL